MSRTAGRPSLEDAHLRSISDDQILDLLETARRRLSAQREATADAQAYASAVASLELEATRRGLVRSSLRERAPLAQVVRRLSHLSPIVDPAEWERLLRELGLPGLWSVYLFVQDHIPPPERLAALAHVCIAVDRIVYGEPAARFRYLKHVELPSTPEARLARLNAALEETFGRIFDAMAAEQEQEGEGEESG